VSFVHATECGSRIAFHGPSLYSASFRVAERFDTIRERRAVTHDLSGTERHVGSALLARWLLLQNPVEDRNDEILLVVPLLLRLVLLPPPIPQLPVRAIQNRARQSAGELRFSFASRLTSGAN
jgi:hypothetical protein